MALNYEVLKSEAIRACDQYLGNASSQTGMNRAANFKTLLQATPVTEVYNLLFLFKILCESSSKVLVKTIADKLAEHEANIFQAVRYTGVLFQFANTPTLMLSRLVQREINGLTDVVAKKYIKRQASHGGYELIKTSTEINLAYFKLPNTGVIVDFAGLVERFIAGLERVTHATAEVGQEI